MENVEADRPTKVYENLVPLSSRKEKSMRWNGWGYKDSQFYVTPQKDVAVTGDRYEICGGSLSAFRPYIEQRFEVEMTPTDPMVASAIASTVPQHLIDAIPAPIVDLPFIEWLQRRDVAFTTDGIYRLNRSHGHALYELMGLKESRIGRIPDMVVWPANHEQTVEIVLECVAKDIVVVPVGGASNVTGALDCPSHETRCIVSLDMTEMNRILWIDENSMMCRAEAGIIGIDLERQLNAKGFTMGHEPDSIEVSSLGGWVATRASGVKKNKYGNIEDLVIHLKMASPNGVFQKSCQVPRMSAGPDIHQFIFGSEGIFGVVTEVTIKIFHQPEVRKVNAILFADFSIGLAFVREVAEQRLPPASVRLIDNEQFTMGYALKLLPSSYLGVLNRKLRLMYVTMWRGFDINKLCAVTFLFEGSKKFINRPYELLQQVAEQEKQIFALGNRYKGIVSGEEDGQYGYRLTFVVAYLRDFLLEYGILGESLETSVPWDKVAALCRNVKEVFERESDKHGIANRVVSCRIPQLYDSGCCVYFYFGFKCQGLNNAVEVFDQIESAARAEIIACGGSISHHHGVGKIRRRWLPAMIGATGMSALKAMKQQFDPRNIFGADNLFTVSKQ